MNTIRLTIASALFLSVAGCSSADELIGQPPPGGAGPGADTMPPGPTPEQCTGAAYVGFDGQSLTDKRVKELAGVNRFRIKPFGALQTEYPRVLGSTPQSLAGAGATFGDVPPRWYEEPQANAVALQTAYTIGFDGCLTYTASDMKYASSPTGGNAPAFCAEWQRKFWSRTPTAAEIQSCSDVAVTASSREPQARRRWAYACASVLTAAGFMTY